MTLEPDRAVEQEYARYEPLLPLERREGEHTLVWRSGSYRLFYDCSGGGDITFTKGGRVMGDFPCDGIPGDLQVVTSEGEQEVTVDVKPGIVYKIGVTTAEPVVEPSTT